MEELPEVPKKRDNTGGKIDQARLQELLQPGPDGKRPTLTKLAKIFGVDPSAVSKMRKKILTRGVRVRDKLDIRISQQGAWYPFQQSEDSRTILYAMMVDDLGRLFKQESETVDPTGKKDIRDHIREDIDLIRMLNKDDAALARDFAQFRVVAAWQSQAIDVVGKANISTCCGEPVVCSKCGKQIDLKTYLIRKMNEAAALAKAAKGPQ
jgi:hypothetical protein